MIEQAETVVRRPRQRKATEPPLTNNLTYRRVNHELSTTVSETQTIEEASYDLKAVNPNRVTETDHRTPVELLNTIAAQKIDHCCPRQP